MSASADDLVKAMEAVARASEQLARTQEEQNQLEKDRRAQRLSNAVLRGPEAADREFRQQQLDTARRGRVAGAAELRKAQASQRSAERDIAAEERTAAQEAARKARKQKEQEAAEAKRRSNPVGKLLGAFRAGGGAGRGVAGAIGSGDLSGALGGILNAGEATGVAAGAVGSVAGLATGIGATVAAVAAFKSAMDAATSATITNYRELARASGVMATVMAQRDVRELIRNRSIGDATAGAAQRLTQAEQDRADAGASFEVAWTEIKSGFLSRYNEDIADILGQLTIIASNIGFLSPVSQPPSLGEMLRRSTADTEAAIREHRQNVGSRRGPTGGDF